MRTLETTRHRDSSHDSGYETCSREAYGGVTNSYEFLPSKTTFVTDDVVVEDFKLRRAQGEYIQNDYQSVRNIETVGTVHDFYVSTRLSDGVVTSFGGQRPYDAYVAEVCDPVLFTGDYLPWKYSLNSPEVQAMCNRALLSAYANANQPEALVGVSLVESRKTAQTARELFNATQNVMDKGLRLGRRYERLKKAGKVTKSLANAWLRYRYELRPLYYDIMSMLKAYDVSQKPARKRFTSSLSLNETDADDYTYPWGNGFYEADFQRRNALTWSVGAGVVVQTSASQQSLAKRLGLASSLQSAWEVIPWSFIVDWFVNTADFMAAYDTELHAGVLGDWVTVRRNGYRSKWVSDYRLVKPSETYSITLGLHSSGTSSQTVRENTRWVNVGKPKAISTNVRLSFPKLIDVAALVRTSGTKLRLLRM